MSAADESSASTDAAPLAVRVRVDGAECAAGVGARVQALAALCGVTADDQETAAPQWVLSAGAIALGANTGAHPRAMQLALAALFHWALADVAVLTVEIYESMFGTWISFEAASLLAETRATAERPPSVRVLPASDVAGVLAALVDEKTQVVDARALQQYLGLDGQQQVVGHLEGAVCVPYDAVFDEETGSFLDVEGIVEELEVASVDFLVDAVVIGSSAIEAAAVATALALAGHAAVQLSLVVLSDELVARLPAEMTGAIFKKDDLLFASEDGRFDLSPGVPESASGTDADVADTTSLEKEYNERIKKPNGDEDDIGTSEDDDDKPKVDEVVWLNPDGHRYFDMPSHMSKSSFVEASRDIYRLVSFVLAPFGFPSRLQERFSVSEIKTRCSALYQDVIEVCSDLVYHHRGLNEGAMAMSVHKWVEKKRDPECSQQVRAINDLLDVLYQPPVFIEVPGLSDDRVVEIAKELMDRLTEVIKKRAPWALETEDDEEKLLTPESEQDDEQQADDVGSKSNGWQDKVYPSVVYTLGFLPPEPKKKHQRLSTLQIKSFIQAAAEVVWEVISKEPCSQIEYQALCDTVRSGDLRETLESIKLTAERALYVIKHSLMQSLEREADVVDTLFAVRNATEDGNRAHRSGRYEVALSYYTNALSMLPVFHSEVAPVLVGRIKCHIQLGRLDQARQETRVLLKIDPFSVGAYTCLGEIEEKCAQSVESMQHFVTAFILDGSRSQDHATSIDRVARSVGRNVAKDIFKEMELQHELPTQWLVESYFDSFEHDIDYAARVPFDIEKSLGVDPAELDAERLLGRAVHYKRKKLYKEARADVLAVLEKGLEDDALHAMALNLHASFLYVVGDVHAAIDVITQSLALKPQSVNGLVKKGGFLSEVGEMEQATECFNEASEVDPNDADVFLHMGQKELLEGNYYEAVQCLRRAMSRSEALPVTHVSYGMALYKSGSVYQAMDVFTDAAKQFPASPEVHLFYGEVLADQGDYDGAMRHFLTAFELSPLCPLPFLNAGRVYVSTNDPLRAIAHFQQALAIDPRCSSAHLDIAQVLFAQGRASEAFHHFDRAAHCCRFLPEVEEVCSAQEMARMQERVTDILGVDLRHIMRSK